MQATKPVMLKKRRSAPDEGAPPSLPSAPKGAEGDKETSIARGARASSVAVVEFHNQLEMVAEASDDLPEATTVASVDSPRRWYETDVAVVRIARRSGRVLLALLDVWSTAVGEHVADEAGSDIYNTLKSAADILLRVSYPHPED